MPARGLSGCPPGPRLRLPPRAPPTRCGPSQHPRPARRTAVPVAGGQDCSSLCPGAERSLKADPSPAPVTEMALDGGQVKTTVMLPTRDVLCLSWWLSGKESAYQCRRRGFNPWVAKIHWRRKWQPTPVRLPGESRGRRSLAGYSPWGCKTVRRDSATIQQRT